MKTYLPTDLIDSSFYYQLNNDHYLIYQNCNNNQCTCSIVYPHLDYTRIDNLSCNIDYNNINANSSLFTDNFYYRIDFANILIIFIILAFVIIWCPIKIMLRFFKRFN